MTAPQNGRTVPLLIHSLLDHFLLDPRIIRNPRWKVTNRTKVKILQPSSNSKKKEAINQDSTLPLEQGQTVRQMETETKTKATMKKAKKTKMDRANSNCHR